MKEKKSKLNLSMILAGNVPGGIGRTERSAKALEQKLSQDRERVAEASELRAHLALVTLAKSLQPSMIPSRSPQEIAEGIERLTRASVELPDVTIGALLSKYAKEIRLYVQNQPTHTNMKEFLSAVIPWKNPETEQQALDPLQPLSSLTNFSSKDRVVFFETNCVSKLLVPLVLEGECEKALEGLSLFAAQVRSCFQHVDPLGLSSGEARLKSQMEELVHYLEALCTPLCKCLPMSVALRNLKDRFGRCEQGLHATEVYLSIQC